MAREENGHEYFVYYKPLIVQPICLQCHGDPETFSPAVRTILEERYPEDNAVGYRAGDLRGLIKVKMTDDNGK
ncbi:MAG: DUF3365 domain-containing protein [Verrucomicrobia bacterium]|nr:DUF3365 domain-containing protein [Verrucomicrobiota bacterium]